jgi:hypothetical protein
MDVLEAVKGSSRAMKECSEALECFCKVVDDGQVTRRELKKLTREVNEALSALAALRLIAEELYDRDGRKRSRK